MNHSRNGKIARLPRTVRNELNRRIDDGESGTKLVEWLNALPEVQAVVTAEFGGKPIREQNLSEWKRGGYRDWVIQQEALELAARFGEDAAELAFEGRAPLTDLLALKLAVRYAMVMRRSAEAEGEEGWRLLREMCGDVVELRKGDHSAERLRIERERLDFDRQRKTKSDDELMAWAMENRDRICGGCLSVEERAQHLREIFGVRERVPAGGDQGQSSPIKPEQAR